MEQQNVTIIGAGIVGLSAAACLVQNGHSVRVIDREGPASGASRGNAAAIAWTDVAPLASPGIWKQALKWLADPQGPLTVRPAYAHKILPWMLRFMLASRPGRVAASTKAIAALNAEAMPSWERLWKVTGTHNSVRRDGCFELFDSEASLKSTRPSWTEQREHGVTVEELSADQLREMLPGLSDRVVGGALVPAWAQVDEPRDLCLSIADWLKGAGAIFQTGAVERIEVGEDGPIAVMAGGGQIPSTHVVVACGAWSKPLAAQLGDRVPLDTERGYNITIPDPKIGLNRYIMLPGHGFVMSPLSTGLRVGGAVEFGGLDLPANWNRVDAMITKAKRFFPGLDASEGERWMGFRPSLPDSLPVIGPSSRDKRVIYAFGHAHHGLTQAAVTGELVSDFIRGVKPEMDLQPFSAQRF